MEKAGSTKKTILLFTISYLLLAGLLFALFRLQGRSLVYQSDGWRQHLRALTYYGKYLRGALRHLFVEHSLSPQTWGVDFGYGADVVTTLQYYCLGDPLAALAVFVPTNRTLVLYELLILLRPYLAGLAFCVYAFLRGEKRTAPVLTGALVHAFSGTVLYIGFLHPYFVNPMIYFPLLLAGMERAIASQKAEREEAGLRRFVPFAAAVALSALCNFYFFYTLAIFTAAYGVARLFQKHGAAGLRGGQLCGTVCRDGAALFGAAFVGVLLAGVLLVPVLAQFKDDPRAEVHFARTWLYEREYYAQLPKNLIGWINHPQMDTELCFALTFLPLAVFLLFRKGHRTLKICLLLTALLLIFPAGGVALNGFSYMINRWTWVTGMLAGWICVRASADIAALLTEKGRVRAERCAAVLFPALTVLSVGWNIVYGFAPQFCAFPKEFLETMDSSAFYAAATDNEVAAVAEAGAADGGAFFRYSGRNLTWNAALASGFSSTQFEFSFANGAVSDYFQMIGVNEEQNFAYYALDDRMPASGLAGVRYYTLAYDNYYEYRFIPYGFVDRGMAGGYRIYENPFALPLGFPMRRILPRSEMEKLTLSAREEVLLQAAVLEDASLQALSGGAIDVMSAAEAAQGTAGGELPFLVRCGDGVRAEDGAFIVDWPGASAEFILSEPVHDGRELLLELENLTVEGWSAYYEPTITARVAGEEWISKQIHYKTPDSQYYSNWHNFAVNFGSLCEGVDTITIDFPEPGVYRFDHLRVTARPMERPAELLQTLVAEGLTETDMHENLISRATGEITGKVSLSEEALLVCTLPYTPGFTVLVDGNKAPVYKTDAMFLSFPVAAGTHDIRLVYRTPGMRTGMFCSAFGMLLMLFMCVRKRFRRT